MPIERPFKQNADFEHLRKVIMREKTGGPVPIIEMMADGSIMGEITGSDYTIDSMTELREMFEPDGGMSDEALQKGLKFIDLNLAFSKAVGYDSALNFASAPVPFTRARYSSADGEKGSRPWQNEHEGLIRDRADFDAFQWPALEQINVMPVEYMAGMLPPGMKIHIMFMGVFEDLRSLMGFEPMAIKSIEEPDLLEDILEKLTVLGEEAVGQAAAHPATGVVFYADDMGFNTNTMLSPDFFRKYIIPRQKRIADVCHRHGNFPVSFMRLYWHAHGGP